MGDVEFKRMVSADTDSKWIILFEFGEISTPIFMMTEYEFARKLKEIDYVKAKKNKGDC